jgi:ABC-type sugar transport system permease subunit
MGRIKPMGPVPFGRNPVKALKQERSARVGWLDSLPAYLLIAPAFLLFGFFFLRPLVQLGSLSLVDWEGLGPKIFVGLENYRELVVDSRFWLAFQHNLMWMVAAIFVPTATGLFLALVLVRSSLYGRLIFRTVYFLPQVLSSVVVSIIWRWIYNPNYGAINTLLSTVGLDHLARGWLGDKLTALPALFIAWGWIHYGFCMVIFIAALQAIDETYYDAAKVDGANLLQQLRYITLPFIRRPLGTVILITIISAFQVFDLVFIITRGGPARATLVLSVFMYDSAFRYAKVGYGAAIGLTLGVVIFLVSLVYLRIRERLEA